MYMNEVVEKLRLEVALLVETQCETLAKEPHPSPWFSQKTGKTYLDYARYVLEHGRMTALTKLKTTLEARQ